MNSWLKLLKSPMFQWALYNGGWGPGYWREWNGTAMGESQVLHWCCCVAFGILQREVSCLLLLCNKMGGEKCKAKEGEKYRVWLHQFSSHRLKNTSGEESSVVGLWINLNAPFIAGLLAKIAAHQAANLIWHAKVRLRFGQAVRPWSPFHWLNIILTTWQGCEGDKRTYMHHPDLFEASRPQPSSQAGKALDEFLAVRSYSSHSGAFEHPQHCQQ